AAAGRAAASAPASHGGPGPGRLAAAAARLGAAAPGSSARGHLRYRGRAARGAGLRRGAPAADAGEPAARLAWGLEAAAPPAPVPSLRPGACLDDGIPVLRGARRAPAFPARGAPSLPPLRPLHGTGDAERRPDAAARRAPVATGTAAAPG